MKRGDVCSLGPHILACGDLERGHAKSLLSLARAYGARPSLVYVDPPWNQAIASTFRRWVDGQVVDFGALLKLVAEACADAADDVYIEMGRAGRVATIAMARAFDLHLVEEWAITYQRGTRPCVLLRFNRSPGSSLPEDSAKGMDSEHTPGWAIKRAGAKVVFDPCLGLGCTLRNADAADVRVVGMELNPERLERAMARSIKIHGQPSIIGTL